MAKRLILVSGMPATGKTTFAQYLAARLPLPLVSYDHIKGRVWQHIGDSCGQAGQKAVGAAGYGLFWDIMEMLLAGGTDFIAEYFFHPQNQDTLLEYAARHNYRLINVHFDAETTVAHSRFCGRNHTDVRHPGLIVPDISLQAFEKGATPNRLFRLEGVPRLEVDTTDFSRVDHDAIAQWVLGLMQQG